MKKLRLARNQGNSGCIWHIMKKDDGGWTSLCGKVKTGPEKDFKGLNKKPPHGKWCGVGKHVFKSRSYKAYRTKGKIHP